MELTEQEHKTANEILQELGMEGSVEDNVGFALEAYVKGNASDDIQRFLQAAGYELFGDGIWSKVPTQLDRDPETNFPVNAAMASEILLTGQLLDIYPKGDLPTEEKELLEEAGEVVNAAVQMRENREESPLVEKIINLAGTSYYGSFEHASTVPWTGYDNLRITEIKMRIEKGEVDDKLDAVLAYEEDKSKPRVTVISYVKKRKEELAKEHRQEEKEEDSQSEEAPEREVEETAPQLSDSGGADGEKDSQSEGQGDSFSTEEYNSLVEDAEKEVKKLILHEPPEPPSEDLNLPYDLTQLTDKALQKAYGAYNALAYRVNYKLLLEEAKLKRVKQAVKELRAYLFAESVKYDHHQHQRTMTDINSHIDTIPEMKEWMQRENLLEVNVDAYRSQRDGLYREVDMLSRLETMRHQEAERSGGRR